MSLGVSYKGGSRPEGSDVVRRLLSLPEGVSVGKNFPTTYTTNTVSRLISPDIMAQARENVKKKLILPGAIVQTIFPQVILPEEETQMTKDELDAKLAQNKAELESVAASMKQEMAQWREQNNSQLSALNASIAALSSKIDGKMDSVDGVVKSFDGKVEGIQGRIDGMGDAIGGISTAITGIQSGLSTKLTIFGILITVVIAVVGFTAAFIGKSADTPSGSPQPIVIQVPQQAQITPAAPAAPTAPAK